MAIGSVAAVVLAGAVMVGLDITKSPEDHSGGRSALGIQVVKMRTKAALTAAVSQDVEYSQTHTTYPSATAIPSRTVDQWSSGTEVNIETFDANGSPFSDVWYSGSCGVPEGTAFDVLYPIHSWWTKTVPVIATQMVEVTGLDVAGRIQDWVSSGRLSVVGTPTIDGQKTIEISGDVLPLGRGACTSSASAPTVVTPTTDQFKLRMWIDPSTYLPIQLITTMTTASEPARVSSTTSTVTWLPPTPANLAKLRGQIPSGFTHLTGPPSIATGSLPTTPA